MILMSVNTILYYTNACYNDTKWVLYYTILYYTDTNECYTILYYTNACYNDTNECYIGSLLLNLTFPSSAVAGLN